jgi:hypothetical protein
MQPHIQFVLLTQIHFLTYAPGLPAIPFAQQQLLAPEPDAPHTSITTLPVPGDFQHQQPPVPFIQNLVEYSFPS